MNRLFPVKTLTTASLLLTSTLLSAAPAQLVTQNDTPFQSNAFVGDNFSIASPHPTPAKSTRSVFWGVVQVICKKRAGDCAALIKMKTDTGAPVNVGVVSVNLTTGIITPTVVKGNGFTITATGPGKTRITQDKA